MDEHWARPSAPAEQHCPATPDSSSHLSSTLWSCLHQNPDTQLRPLIPPPSSSSGDGPSSEAPSSVGRSSSIRCSSLLASPAWLLPLPAVCHDLHTRLHPSPPPPGPGSPLRMFTSLCTQRVLSKCSLTSPLFLVPGYSEPANQPQAWVSFPPKPLRAPGPLTSKLLARFQMAGEPKI